MMFHTMPVARSMPTSSSGEEMAASAASLARFLPLACPCPMRADPEPAMTVRTSAKSTLTRPGTCRGSCFLSCWCCCPNPCSLLKATRTAASRQDHGQSSVGCTASQQGLTVMMSEMPRTPCLRTSSATLKASVTGRLTSTAAAAGDQAPLRAQAPASSFSRPRATHRLAACHLG